MRGIGKTQNAIEYVHANRGFYERVYSITAVDQVSLLLGYRNVAVKAGLKNLLYLPPFTISEGVIRWLGENSSWLVVLDDVDDIIVIAELLPPTGSRPHTLITTINPNARDNPVEGREVPLLAEAEGLELPHIVFDRVE